MEEGSRRPEASPEVLKDSIHAVKFYLLDGFPNLLVKSRIDPSSCFKIVCKELIFLF